MILKLTEATRKLTRPIVTFSLVAAQIALAIAWLSTPEAEKPSAFLAPFTMMVLRDWFNSRQQAETPNGGKE